MKYKFNRTNFNDFSLYELNKLPGRAYAIPYGDINKLKKTPFSRERSSSELVRVLSGKWDFKYYSENTAVPDIIDTDTIDFDEITVPSTWQRTGYEPPVYLNCPYPFDDAPPCVPSVLPVGIYRKHFNAEAGKNYILSFLGVIPCIDIYINGKFVGYSEGAHNSAEFNITEYITDGKNELVAAVHKWSNATFLECQDMFRENGIFRDVLLYELPEVYINDFCLRSAKKSVGWSLAAELEIVGNTEGCEVRLELTDGKKLISSARVAADKELVLTLDKLCVEEWNAEVPTLYEAYITLSKGGCEIMSIRNFTGFKTVKIKKDLFTFNGKTIKMKGVNHHDTHYKNGYVMSFNDLEKDIKLMKSLNVNTVRTSHYPPDHQFLVLCDIYGLYVIDEADIETHGCCCDPHNSPKLISHNSDWIPRYVDRVKRMYLRDRNRACITLWSLGNEAEGWKCQDACYDYLHSVCPEIPVHYEGVIRTPRHSYDVVSEMYTSHRDVERIGRHRRGIKYSKKPFVLCEYAHAMGVGPGALEDYWDIIYKYENLMGGCIWEWADHAVYHSSGKLKYTYGGDHGEKKHDGNFCVDGLMYPDRRPHTGALEMQAVYRPVRAEYKDGSIIFTNTNRFRNSAYLRADWTLVKNGSEELRKGSVWLNIEPRADMSVDFDFEVPKDDCDCHINICYYDGKKFVAREQIALKEKYECEIPKGDGRLTVEADGEKTIVGFENGQVVFNSTTGMLESYAYAGKELINQAPAFSKGFYPNIFRALLDNDNRYRSKWLNAGYDDYTVTCRSFESELDDDEAEINVEFALRSKKGVIAVVKTEYEILANGVIEVEASLKPEKAKLTARHFLRFGLTLEMPEEFKNVEYYGLGEYESLSDFKAQCIVGKYKTTVADMEEPYIKPQDSGNRTEVREFSLTDDSGDGLRFCYDESLLSFNVRSCSLKTLAAAKHREDLKNEHTTAVNVDGFLRGTGTSSCGPDVLDKYDINASDGLEFSFTIVPIKNS